MKRSPILLVSLAVLVLLACKLASKVTPFSQVTQEASGNQETAQPAESSGESSSIFDIPTNPVQITVTPDSASTVATVIPVDGGTITATGADGTVYELVIPPNALQLEAQITLTPIAAISGLPFGNGQSYAVQLAPEGLFLYESAILTITPTQPLPVNQQILFGYRGAGENLILALPVKDSQEIKIQVLHLSGYGATAEVSQSGMAAPVGGNAQEILLLGGDADSRMENTAAVQAQNERRDVSNIGIVFETAYKEYKEKVLKPRIQAAGDSCDAGRLALETILGAMRQASLLGGQEIYDELYDEMMRLVPIVAENCMLEEYEHCQNDHIIHRVLPFYLSWNRQYQLMFEGMPEMVEVDQRMRKYVELCLRFEVVLESTAVEGDQEFGFESWVKATVPMNFSFDAWKYVGKAPLVNESFVYHYELEGCTEIANRGGGTFESPQLRVKVEYASPDDQIGRVSELFLDYFPGETSEEYGYKCWDSSFGPVIAPLWTGVFIATHEADANPEVGFTATDWEIFGNEYYAKKEWQIDMPDLELVEVGTFKLYHKPGG